MTRLLASPTLHFVVLGALLYATEGFWSPAIEAAPAEPVRKEIVVLPATIDELRANFRKTTGREPDQSEQDLLVRDYADREILYREALARQLDKNDRSVRWRLVQKMQFLEDRDGDDPDLLYEEALDLGLDRDDIVIRRLLIEKMRLLIKLGAVSEPPAESILQEFYDQHAEDYRQPARVSIEHVFFSTDKRGDSTRQDAARALTTVRPMTPDEAIRLGDVFALGHRYRNNSEHNLAKLLGPHFAAAVIDLAPGEWHGPVESAYGYHLVWVEDRQDSELPGLDPVRNQVLQRYLAELREAELARTMQRLRDDYAVTVRPSAREQG